MQQAIVALGALPRMDRENYPTQTDLDGASALLRTAETLCEPLSVAEAALLIPLLPSTEDSLYGLAWGLVHLIERAGAVPVAELAARSSRTSWEQFLVDRARRGGRLSP